MANRKPKSQSEIANEIREKANKAEARSAKAPKADTVKAADKPVAEPKPPKPAKTQNRIKNDDEIDRAVFLDMLPKVAKQKSDIKAAADVVSSLKGALRNMYKQALADGFSASDFEEALQMQKAEGEKARRAAIQRSLRIARWLGMDLGAQLDMFEEPSRVPAVDRAFEEGKSASLKGESPKCDYAPDLPQHQRFMEGWHAGQEIRSKGFKKLHPEVEADEKAKLIKKTEREAEQAKDAVAFDAPASGVAMTRAEHNRLKEQQQQAKPN